MNAYVYQAALLCEECAAELKEVLTPIAAQHPTVYTTDCSSDLWPQGPYGDGGGESDCPQHCDRCHVFLENPLTSDGEAYVRDAYFRGKLGEGDPAVTQEWREFYSYAFSCFE